MSEWYVLRDIDNRGDDGDPWETTSSTLSGFIGYVDGPLRSDVTSDEAREAVDEAIDALRRENFNLAEASLRELGVYIRREVGEQGMNLDEYIRQSETDSNLFWRLDSGQVQNLLDEAIELIEGLRAIIDSHPNPLECEKHDDDDTVSCGWKIAYTQIVQQIGSGEAA